MAEHRKADPDETQPVIPVTRDKASEKTAPLKPHSPTADVEDTDVLPRAVAEQLRRKILGGRDDRSGGS